MAIQAARLALPEDNDESLAVLDDIDPGAAIGEQLRELRLVKNLTLREIQEDATAFLELKTGGVDLLLGVPTDFLPRINAEKALKVVTMPGTEVFYMPMNTSVAPQGSRSPRLGR